MVAGASNGASGTQAGGGNVPDAVRINPEKCGRGYVTTGVTEQKCWIFRHARDLLADPVPKKGRVMGISELRRHFTAYRSGELGEFQLRSLIRNALTREPQRSPELIALTEACRRANLIDAQLQSTINADIVALSGQSLGLTMVRPPVPEPLNNSWFSEDRAANSTDIHLPLGITAGEGFNLDARPYLDTGPSAAAAFTGSLPRTGWTGGSSWEVADRRSDVGAPLYPGAVLRDRFVLVEELGRGGMGVVYKAYDRSRGDVKDRYVAIKVLSEEFKRHPLAVKALQREARKAQKLAHPNVVAVHDFDRDGGNVYMVMELLSGRSLDQVLRDDGQGGIPLGPAMEIVRSLAAALSYAHEHDIVHCDFKPSNAFLGCDGRVKVLDFGIARAAPSLAGKGDATLFDAGQLGAVSPAYASLELLQGEQPDVRDDVYSFACVVYELLTGSHPYQRIDAVKASQTGLQPRPVRKLSRNQWRALKQGLAFRRAERCPTVDALARDLLAPQVSAGFWLAVGAAGLAGFAVLGLLSWHWPDIRQASSGWTARLTLQHPHRPARSAAAAEVAMPRPAPAVVTAAPSPEPSAVIPTPPTAPANPAEVAPSGSADVAPSGSADVGPPGSADVGPAATATDDNRLGERRRVEIDMLKEQFETQAAAGDVAGATRTANVLGHATAGSAYVSNDIPRILILSYVHLAKAQFAAGQVNEALQTLKEGRRRFGRSTELRDLEVRYVAAGDLYDRMSSAVVLNVTDAKRALDDLKGTEGDDYETTAQMLAQTLGDRIADHRAAGRDPVADKLADAGRQIFPEYAEILGRGRAGKLPTDPIQVSDQ